MDKAPNTNAHNPTEVSKHHQPIPEDFSYDQQYNKFLMEVNNLKPVKKKVDGEKLEYVQLSQLSEIYHHVFGRKAVSNDMLRFKIRKLLNDHLTRDIQKFADLKDHHSGFEPYYINRLNDNVMKTLFIPTSSMDEDTKIRKTIDNVKELEEYSRAVENQNSGFDEAEHIEIEGDMQ
jgi:hypothetical protein